MPDSRLSSTQLSSLLSHIGTSHRPNASLQERQAVITATLAVIGVPLREITAQLGAVDCQVS